MCADDFSSWPILLLTQVEVERTIPVRPPRVRHPTTRDHNKPFASSVLNKGRMHAVRKKKNLALFLSDSVHSRTRRWAFVWGWPMGMALWNAYQE